MRHAKSDWTTGQDDHARPLNPRGQRAAAAMGAHLSATHPVPDLALISDAARTRETWQRMGWQARKVTFRPDLYLASDRSILDLIRAQDASLSTLFLLGHNPGFESLSAALTYRGAEEAEGSGTEPIPNPYRTQPSKPFPTGAALTLSCSAPSWREISPENCAIRAFQTPKTLD